MKKKFVLVMAAFFFLSSPLFGTECGTFFAGVKSWYTFWDSGALKWYGNQLEQNFNGWGIPISVETKTGDGYLVGPLFGYMTPSGNLNVSFAPMILSDFHQDQEITVLDSEPEFPNTVEIDIDLERRDYDLAVSYSLSGLEKIWSFFNYCKLFAGLKYQTVEFDMRAMRLTDGSLNGPILNSSMDYTVLMPTVGLGIAYPFTKKIILSAQGGIGKAYIDEGDTTYNGYEYELDPADSTAYNGELGLNIIPMERMIVQLGYRYQQWTFDPRTDEGAYPSGSYKDINQGPSLSLVYTF